jgi:hypothetical protein
MLGTPKLAMIMKKNFKVATMSMTNKVEVSNPRMSGKKRFNGLITGLVSLVTNCVIG